MKRKGSISGRILCKKAATVVVCAVLMLTAGIQTTGIQTVKASTLDQQIEEAKSELEQVKKDQSEVMTVYDQGSIGFVDWMLAKSNLTTKQKYDLDRAKTVLQEACEEDFSKWAGGNNTGLPESRNNKVVVTGDKKDAISLENTKATFAVLNKINSLRDTDENYVGAMKRNAAKTNFYFMAVAQSGADRGAGLTNHSLLQVSCENLAFGYTDPAAGWNSEKASFNKIRDELGYSSITSQSQLTAVEQKADSEGVTVGHYTNMFWAADQVMGVGFTLYGRYGNTSCFNASKLSNYTSKYEVYTIAEFEKLFDEYYETVDPEKWQKKVDAAQAKLDKLLGQRYDSCTEHVYGEGVKKEATCTETGGTVYTCAKCGYKKIEDEVPAMGHSFTDGVCERCKITGPKSMEVNWRIANNYTSSTYDQEFEVGKNIETYISFSTASASKSDDKFVFDIADPAIITYTPSSNCEGVFHMNKIGETTVTVYPAVNPDMKKVITVSVTDVGGHNYVISQAEPGTGETEKICSKCGMTKTVTIPTAITRTEWWIGNHGTYKPVDVEVGDEINLEVDYAPTKVDNSEFIVTSSDQSIVKVGDPESSYRRYAAKLTAVGTGDVTIRIVHKYDSSICQEYTFNVADQGGHEYVISEADEGESQTVETCSKCGYEKIVSLPTSIRYVYWQEKDSDNRTTSPSEYEIGAELSINIMDWPTRADIHEYAVTSSDETVVKVNEVSRTAASLSAIGNGVVTITVASKYNPWVKAEYELDITEIGGHSYTAEIVNDETLAQAATCTTAAKYYYSCDNCGRVNRKKTFTHGDSLGHDYAPKYEWSANGNTCKLVLTCTRDSDHVIDANMTVTSTVTNASCENDGAKVCTAKCTLNGKNYTDVKTIVISALGHRWNSGVVKKGALCETEGLMEYTCGRCGRTKGEKIEPIGYHTPGEAVYENEITSTCMEEGSRDKVIYCTVCGAEISRENEVVSKTEHKKRLVGVKKATCVSGGYTGDVVCSMCGEIFETGTATDPVDHSYTAKKTTEQYLKKAADYDYPAEYYYACVYCGAKGETSYAYGSKLTRKSISSAKVTLNKTEYTYDGNSKNPAVTVKLGNKTLNKGIDYTVSYNKNKAAGTAETVITGTGAYQGQKTINFKIKKASNSITLKKRSYRIEMSTSSKRISISQSVSARAGKLSYSSDNKAVKVDSAGTITIAARYIGKANITVYAGDSNHVKVKKIIPVTVSPKIPGISQIKSPSAVSVRLKWGKISYADGYQIQYSTTSNFKKGTYDFMVLSGGSKTTASLGAKQRIKGGKTYYVRVRSFSNKSGTRCYSAWSKTKSVRVRK